MGIFRLLVAGRNEIERKGICAIVQGQPNWEVAAEARDGREAVERTKQIKPDIAIIHLDMPLLNGLDATRQIAKGALQTKVLLLAPQDSDQLLSQALEAGARGYLLKSDTAGDLVSAVKALCQGRSFFTAAGEDLSLNKIKKAQDKSVQQLTGRQREVVQLLAEGHSNKQVGIALNISAKTAETHRANIMKKIDCHSVTGLVRYAIRNHIIEA